MHIKRLFSLLLVLTLLFTTAAAAFASDRLPESEHNYANGVSQTWTYALDDAPYGAVITFSEDTFVERVYDTIEIFDGNGKLAGTYSGDALAGAGVYVPTAGFSITLTTDSSVSYYGFRVTDVRAAAEEEITTVIYHPCMEGAEDVTFTFCSAVSQTAQAPTFTRDGYFFAGWADEEGGNVCSDAEAVPQTGQHEFWAVWVKLALGQDEIFDFNNSETYFNVDGKDHYYISAEDYRMMQRNLFKTYGLGPYPTPIVASVLSAYPKWEWIGSCYGISTVTALQHFGKIDVLSLQNAESMSQMKADETLISYINYYQSQVATSWLTEHKASFIGTSLYKTQLKKMFKSVSEGNLVLFSFYEEAPFVTSGHTVLLTGAFTKSNGDHILLCYDSNRPWAYGDPGSIDVSSFTIPADWSEIRHADYYKQTLGAIHWTDDFSQFQSFDINGKGSPFTWHQSYFRHIFGTFRTLFQTLATLFGF